MLWASSAGYQAAFGSKEAIQLTDRELPRTGAVVESVMTAALNEAEQTITALLRRRYPDFPTPTIPEAVKSRTYHVARYFLHDKNVPETVRSNYQDALAFLDKAVFTEEEMGLAADADAGPKTAAAPTKAVAYTSAFRDQYDYHTPRVTE